MITCYADFRQSLMEVGFSMMTARSGDSPFSLLEVGWSESPPADCPIRWHTGEPDTDPWQWRTRLIDDGGVGYSKMFMGKAGYVTSEWAPTFIAARSGGMAFEDAYADGVISRAGRLIYDSILAEGRVTSYDLRKRFAGEKGVDRAVVDLQDRMYITILGEEQRRDRFGKPYGWPTSVYGAAESFWGEGIIAEAMRIHSREAKERIAERAQMWYPHADAKAVKRLIG